MPVIDSPVDSSVLALPFERQEQGQAQEEEQEESLAERCWQGQGHCKCPGQGGSVYKAKSIGRKNNVMAYCEENSYRFIY